MENKLAPIVLFVYNRPWHTLQTLESLKNNELASESELFIYADGPKDDASIEDLEKIKETREIVRDNNWCGKVHIFESNHNKGLANSVINGVTEVINKFGKIIVLEDDIVTSKGFLRYMNDALDFYKNNHRVMHISGYMFPLKCKLPETFFYNATSCWGWGTWKHSWDLINLDANDLLEKINLKGNLDNFDYKKTFGFIQQLQQNANGILKTWAIKWHASVYLANGFCLHPNISLVNNIGHDLSGQNCVSTDVFSWNKLADKINVDKIKIEGSEIALKNMIKFYSKFQPSKVDTIVFKTKLFIKYIMNIKILSLKNV
jgi:hypothetical protein